MGREVRDALVHFIELAGPTARAALERSAAGARAAGAAVELLAAEDQADLWLLLVRDAVPDVPPDVPAGARHWRFRAVAP